jgi:hypothetical protein
MPTENTTRLNLPLIMPSQAQKHVTHNEAIARLDRLAHPAVESRTLLAPPAGPDSEAAWLVPAEASGAWATHEGEIALPLGTGWEFLPPFAGLKLLVRDESAFTYFDGASWADLGGAPLSGATQLGVNAEADEVTRLAVASAAVAFSHDPEGDGDMRVVVNKAALDRTASLVFQSQWEGRAEFGLAGSDALGVKVSADGASWTTSATFPPAGGMHVAPALSIGEDVGSVSTLTLANGNPILSLNGTAGVGNAHLGIFNWVDANGEEKVWCGLGSSGNTAFTFLSHYPDGLQFYAYGGNYPIVFRQDTEIRINVHTNGCVGISEAAPTAPLHVGGALRVGSYAVSTLPSASGTGAGAFIFVADDSAGATLAFSDGATWRRVHDRQPVG